MAYAPINAATANDSANLLRQGRSVHIQLRMAFGTMAKGASLALGRLAADAKVAPTIEQPTQAITAQDEDGGQTITVEEVITSTSIKYSGIEVVTPDDAIRAIHDGAPPTPIVSAGLEGATISPFDPGASISVALTVLRKQKAKADGSDIVTVYWHPDTALTSAGYGDGEANTDRPRFDVTVRPWDGSLTGALLAAYDGVKTVYGAIFRVPRSKLNKLQEALAEVINTDIA